MRVRWLVVAAALTVAVSARADVYFSLSNAPPPPIVRFENRPAVILVPGTRVYVLEDHGPDYSLFRYGTRWYLFDQGWWYRSSDWDGPYTAVAVRTVPGVVLHVPERYWNDHWSRHPHGGPPGLTKKHPGRGKAKGRG